MLTKEMLQKCFNNIEHCIQHTKQVDSKKEYELLKDGKQIVTGPTIQSIADFFTS